MIFLAPPGRERLDKLIVALLKAAGAPVSRATAQRWIDAGRVTVDGVAARASSEIREGARILVEPEAPPPSRAEADASIALSIVFEDDHLVVIDKPAGLVMHPARGHAGGTLVNGLLARDGFQRASADPRDPAGHLRPGIVHRLDKGTSGLVVVAKTESAREGLKARFAAHDIDREYLAIAVGRTESATIATLHARHPTDRLRFTSRTEEGRRAVTHLRVIDRLHGTTLVACTLETGRTHQIRVHLAEQAKTPILADTLYGSKPTDAVVRGAAEVIGRQALHARVLGFEHPVTGRKMRWESAPPDDFAACLEALRRATKPSI